eukprot:gnl/TRDRNA2_/TRDRNA2_35406_c0_seq1.p1 gnl/TRDRNA2_/TRDRNA2_35406_c0~~gnl/TRDRNA2_/TRDRNA2_35406_c0_seq1.p1  ORF type:complete len:151 (-),score=6.92 gnl/TRDRNA2_/TRDRNA2_35406_c0_seq1:220-672(-)
MDAMAQQQQNARISRARTPARKTRIVADGVLKTPRRSPTARSLVRSKTVATPSQKSTIRQSTATEGMVRIRSQFSVGLAKTHAYCWAVAGCDRDDSLFILPIQRRHWSPTTLVDNFVFGLGSTTVSELAIFVRPGRCPALLLSMIWCSDD